MSKLKPVVTSRSLELGVSSPEIKKKIDTDSKKRYAGLKVERNALVYCTEGIYPDRSKHRDRIPVLFLFSNPYPESVEKGLFLSEPHSRTFWQRLSEVNKNYLQLPQGAVNREHWDESIPRLGEIMLKGDYKSPFLLYFHCLYPIPTRQLADLKRLFKGEPQLWAEVRESSRKELCRLIKNEQIKHIVVFGVEVFREITEASKDTCKGWREKIKCAVNNYGNDMEKYWAILSAGYAKTKLGSSDVEVYLGLNTRSKDIGKEMKKRYFTWALDMILARIRAKPVAKPTPNGRDS